MVKSVKFGSKEICDNKPTFITFEAGATHNGLESAKRMLKAVAKSGASAIKFQKVDPERSCPDKNLMFEYEVLVNKDTGKTEKVKEPLQEILKRRYLSDTDFKELVNLAKSLNVEIFATAQFAEDIKLFKDLDLKSVKIGSSNLTNFNLIKAAAKANLILQIDTGMSQFSDVEKTVDFYRSEGGKDFIIHNCPSGYPAKPESINLNILKSLKILFDMPVGFSDHSEGFAIDIAAIALGANLIEKTITEDRTQKSIEHLYSIETDELGKFVKIIRDVEKSFGSSRRILNDIELLKKRELRRSVYLNKDIPKGSFVLDDDIEMRMDPHGIPYQVFSELKHFSLSKNCNKFNKLKFTDFSFD